MVKKKKVSESKSQKEERLGKMKERIKKIESSSKLEKELENAEEKLRKLRNPKEEKKPMNISSGISFGKAPLEKPRLIQQEAVILNPESQKTKRMWLESVWEKRREIDPEVDPDRWFNESMWLDRPDYSRNVDDFWTGPSIQETKNRNADNFWLR